MSFRIALILLVFVVSGAVFSSARPPKPRPSKAVDRSYASALSAANRFLHAWQTQNHEAGIMMLTDEARRHVSPEKLQEFFSPGEQAAFEIQRGRRLNGGEYVFPVVLFGVAEHSRPHACRLLITRSGKDEWAINRLP